jgi:hypothetical protein
VRGPLFVANPASGGEAAQLTKRARLYLRETGAVLPHRLSLLACVASRMRGRWGAAGEAKSSGQVECAQKVRTGLNLSVVIADKSGLENPSNLSTNTFATHNAVKWAGPLGGGALSLP